MSSQFGFLPRSRKTVSNLEGSFAVDGDVLYAAPAGFVSAAAITTADDSTLTTKDVLGGMILRDCTGAARTDTLPTAALLAAAYNGCATGSSVTFSVRNISDVSTEVLTLAVGTGITAYAGSLLTVQPGEVQEYMMIFSSVTPGSEAATLYFMGGNNSVNTPGTVTVANDTTDGTLNTRSGVVTITASTLGAEAAGGLTLTNSTVTASSVVLASIVDYSGTYQTNGFPGVNIDSVSDGSFDIILYNSDATSALNGAVQVSFLVIN